MRKIIIILGLFLSLQIFAETTLELEKDNTLGQATIQLFKKNQESGKFVESQVIEDENFFYLISVLKSHDDFKNLDLTSLKLDIVQKRNQISQDIGDIMIALQKSDKYIGLLISIVSREWYFLNHDRALELKIGNTFYPLKMKTSSSQKKSYLVTTGLIINTGENSIPDELISTITNNDLKEVIAGRIYINEKPNIDIKLPIEFIQLSKKYIFN